MRLALSLVSRIPEVDFGIYFTKNPNKIMKQCQHPFHKFLKWMSTSATQKKTKKIIKRMLTSISLIPEADFDICFIKRTKRMSTSATHFFEADIDICNSHKVNFSS